MILLITISIIYSGIRDFVERDKSAKNDKFTIVLIEENFWILY